MAPLLMLALSKAVSAANINLSQLKANANNGYKNRGLNISDLASTAQALQASNSGISSNGVV